VRTGGKFQEFCNNKRRIRELTYFISFLLHFIFLSFIKFNLGVFRFFNLYYIKFILFLFYEVYFNDLYYCYLKERKY